MAHVRVREIWGSHSTVPKNSFTMVKYRQRDGITMCSSHVTSHHTLGVVIKQIKRVQGHSAQDPIFLYFSHCISSMLLRHDPNLCVSNLCVSPKIHGDLFSGFGTPWSDPLLPANSRKKILAAPMLGFPRHGES